MTRESFCKHKFVDLERWEKSALGNKSCFLPGLSVRAVIYDIISGEKLSVLLRGADSAMSAMFLHNWFISQGTLRSSVEPFLQDQVIGVGRLDDNSESLDVHVVKIPGRNPDRTLRSLDHQLELFLHGDRLSIPRVHGHGVGYLGCLLKVVKPI